MTAMTEKLATAFKMAIIASRAVCDSPKDSKFITSQSPSQIHIGDEDSSSGVTFSFDDSVSTEPARISYRIPNGSRDDVYEIVRVDSSDIYELRLIGFKGAGTLMATFNEQKGSATFNTGIGPKRQVRAVSILKVLEGRVGDLLQPV